MLGAIAGDIIGSVYEFNNVKTTDFPLFTPQSRPTDDTILTIAVADCILTGKDYARTLKEYYQRYSDAGYSYGERFQRWAASDSLQPYNSWGNGSAMRVSPVGFAYASLGEISLQAKRSAEVTHNHPEGIKGARAVAAAIFVARTIKNKNAIRDYIQKTFGYDLTKPLDELREQYKFDESCQGTVPPAIIAFLASNDFEDAIRKAVSLGGDSDTLACITGGIAHAFYGGVPPAIRTEVFQRLNDDLKRVVRDFCARYGCG